MLFLLLRMTECYVYILYDLSALVSVLVDCWVLNLSVFMNLFLALMRPLMEEM